MTDEKKEEWIPQQKELEALHTMRIEHNYDVNFSVISDKKDFLDALMEIDSLELGNQLNN